MLYNIQASSHNHCCREKAIRITYFCFGVCVCSVCVCSVCVCSVCVVCVVCSVCVVCV